MEFTKTELPKIDAIEHLPKAVTLLFVELHEIKRLLNEQSLEAKPEPPVWFDLTKLCDYLPDKPTKPTVYGYVHNGTIPFHKGNGQKKLRFLKSEIDEWLRSGRNKTIAEIAREADTYIKRKAMP